VVCAEPVQPELAGDSDLCNLVTGMTLIIQRTEHRDTQAVHAQLDKLLRSDAKARPELSLLDHQEPEVIEEHRSQERRELR